ncbi:cbb3-type cytochrome oxidase subunit 3 [Thiohalobacter thiocyanaticus]|uniref:Cbb3-type cytochrome c oxidase subunit 3 n=1 Tax=Thiohalobacter thiocyanaticus TaxID=585455 RepID=A0A426QK44_9GAMM|nr:cbb3-type cytochrome c oxidase subunit 3 [Thiohalobacter thiocyanaticus]RRQ22120.1 cbb3-type cytochrome c oxidase subunit 3 [Thiohalobacter thiocyanaticus]
MSDLLRWIGQFENSKIVALLIFFVTFCAIIIYVFTGKRRKQRLESYKYIPFEDEEASQTQRKVDKDE